jgi:predicted ester cyclase
LAGYLLLLGKTKNMKNLLWIIIAACGICLLAAFVEKPAETSLSLTARNKFEMQRFYEEMFNRHDIKMIDSLVSPEYLEHQTDVHYSTDRKGLRKEFKDYFDAFPDAVIKTHFMVAEGDLVSAQYTITATHQGNIYGRNASNKKINISGVDIVRFKNGKAVEHWGYLEEGKLLTQLGVIRELMKRDKTRAEEN